VPKLITLEPTVPAREEYNALKDCLSPVAWSALTSAVLAVLTAVIELDKAVFAVLAIPLAVDSALLAAVNAAGGITICCAARPRAVVESIPA
jgi:hypothetical protein